MIIKKKLKGKSYKANMMKINITYFINAQQFIHVSGHETLKKGCYSVNKDVFNETLQKTIQ